jgi:hypothetical protein
MAMSFPSGPALPGADVAQPVEAWWLLRLLSGRGVSSAAGRSTSEYDRIFDSLDADHDGELTRQEFVEKGRY